MRLNLVAYAVRELERHVRASIGPGSDPRDFCLVYRAGEQNTWPPVLPTVARIRPATEVA